MPVPTMTKNMGLIQQLMTSPSLARTLPTPLKPEAQSPDLKQSVVVSPLHHRHQTLQTRRAPPKRAALSQEDHFRAPHLQPQLRHPAEQIIAHKLLAFSTQPQHSHNLRPISLRASTSQRLRRLPLPRHRVDRLSSFHRSLGQRFLNLGPS